jgi:hypothetical protein
MRRRASCVVFIMNRVWGKALHQRDQTDLFFRHVTHTPVRAVALWGDIVIVGDSNVAANEATSSWDPPHTGDGLKNSRRSQIGQESFGFLATIDKTLFCSV